MPDVALYNLAVIDLATKGGVIAAARLYLLAAGSGRTLDYADASAFLAEFDPFIQNARKRRNN